MRVIKSRRRKDGNYELTTCSVAKDITSDIHVLPYNQSFDSSKFESLQRIVDAEAIFASVLADLIKVLLDKPFLLHELDVSERLGSKLDSLE